MRRFTLIFLVAASISAAQQPAQIGSVLKRQPETDGSYLFLRNDLQVQNSSGNLLPPEMGAASHLVFSDDAAHGEFCVLAEEIDPVIDALRHAGIDITGLGSRFAGEQPGLYFLEFRGEGPTPELARKLKVALDELGKERLVREGLLRTGKPPIVDWTEISRVLRNPVVEIAKSKVMRVTHSPGTWVTIGGCPCGRSMLSGRFAVPKGKLQSAIRALREGGFTPTSINAEGDGSLVYFEGEGDAARMAAGVRDAWRLLDD